MLAEVSYCGKFQGFEEHRKETWWRKKAVRHSNDADRQISFNVDYDGHATDFQLTEFYTVQCALHLHGRFERKGSRGGSRLHRI